MGWTQKLLILFLLFTLECVSQVSNTVNEKVSDILVSKMNVDKEVIFEKIKNAKTFVVGDKVFYYIIVDEKTVMINHQGIVVLYDINIKDIKSESQLEENSVVIGNVGVIVGGFNEGDTSNDLIKVKSHTYFIATNINELKRLKGIHTYVIFPRNLSLSIDKSSKRYKRYIEVLGLIQELPKVENNESINIDDNYTNQFILPQTKISKNTRVTVDTYNYKLANEILNILKKQSRDLPFTDEGPFLITTVDDIFNNKTGFLYVNMSTFNDSSIEEVITSYKKRLIDKGNTKFTILEKMKYQILSVITNANNDICIVKSAIIGKLD